MTLLAIRIRFRIWFRREWQVKLLVWCFIFAALDVLLQYVSRNCIQFEGKLRSMSHVSLTFPRATLCHVCGKVEKNVQLEQIYCKSLSILLLIVAMESNKLNRPLSFRFHSDYQLFSLKVACTHMLHAQLLTYEAITTPPAYRRRTDSQSVHKQMGWL